MHLEAFHPDTQPVEYYKPCPTGRPEFCHFCDGEGSVGAAEPCRMCGGTGICQWCRQPILAVRFTINRRIDIPASAIIVTVDTIDVIADGGFVWKCTLQNGAEQQRFTTKSAFVMDERGNVYKQLGNRYDIWLPARARERLRIEFAPIPAKATTFTLCGLAEPPFVVKLARP